MAARTGADSRKVSLGATGAALHHSMTWKASWRFQTHILIMVHNNDLHYQKRLYSVYLNNCSQKWLTENLKLKEDISKRI